MEKLMEAVAEQVPAMVGLGKAYLWISVIGGVIAFALVIAGGLYTWKTYNKAYSRAKEKRQGETR